MKTYKTRRITRARDKRADMLIQEAINESDAPPIHADSHSVTGADPILPSSIGAETPQGAQTKVDTHENKSNPHTGSQPVSSFATIDRPTGINTGFMGFDTDLGIPIWWNGTDWVNSSGTIV